jgi:hypothetical protein
MPNKWITFVKEWSAKNSMSYGCALSNSTMKTDYYKKHPNKKSNKAKEIQDTMGMSAEDKDAPAKPKPKPKKLKKKLVLKQEVAPSKPVVKKISAAKKVIDNFDLLKKISDFGIDRDGLVAYKGYSPARIRKLMKDPGLIEIAERFLESGLPIKGRRLGVPFAEDYLSKSTEKKTEMLKPYLLRQAYNELDKLEKIDDWKKEQKNLLTKDETIDIEMAYPKKFGEYEDKQAYNTKTWGRTNNLYINYKKKWYFIGYIWSETVRGDDKDGKTYFDAWYSVPNYKFNIDGEDVTNTTRSKVFKEEPYELTLHRERMGE